MMVNLKINAHSCPKCGSQTLRLYDIVETISTRKRYMIGCNKCDYVRYSYNSIDEALFDWQETWDDNFEVNHE